MMNECLREVFIETKDILQELGFELVYVDTDSVFLKKNGASLEDFEFVKDAFEREAGLPISVEHHHKFLVLLPLVTFATSSVKTTPLVDARPSTRSTTKIAFFTILRGVYSRPRRDQSHRKRDQGHSP